METLGRTLPFIDECSYSGSHHAECYADSLYTIKITAIMQINIMMTVIMLIVITQNVIMSHHA